MFIVLRRSSSILRLGSSLPNTFAKPLIQNGAVLNSAKLSPLIGNDNSFYCKTFCSDAPASGVNIAEITNGDKELEHKLKVLMLEVDVLRQEGRLVPDDCYLKDHHWKELLAFPSISARRRYLEYLFKLSKKKENRLVKKEQKKLEWEQIKPEKKENETFEEFVSKYDLQHNNLFLRFYDTTINQMYNNRLVQSMQYGQKLVVDCGFDDKMTSRESRNCAKQLMLLFAENRFNDDPYDLHFCNTNPNNILMKALHRHITTLYEPWFPLSVHQVSYLDLFPKEQLVYLTPHCREELVEYDHDAIYIIGGIVDKVNSEPLSLAKAKKEGLKMAKFPLDRYLQWGSGSGKNLTLNQVAAILLDVKQTGDWKYALRHVPKRKIVEVGEINNNHQMSRTRWTPSANNVNSNKLKFNSTNRNRNSGNRNDSNKQNERRVDIKSIMND